MTISTCSSFITTKAPSLSNMKIGVCRSQNSRMLPIVRAVSPKASGYPRLSPSPSSIALHNPAIPSALFTAKQTNKQKFTWVKRTVTHNCLHMPQGLAGGEISVATATALNFLWPSVTALPNATRSAQVPTG